MTEYLGAKFFAGINLQSSDSLSTYFSSFESKTPQGLGEKSFNLCAWEFRLILCGK